MDAKNNHEFMSILRAAWTAGHQAGRPAVSDKEPGIIADCQEIADRHPQYVAAPDLLAACERLMKHFSKAGDTWCFALNAINKDPYVALNDIEAAIEQAKEE